MRTLLVDDEIPARERMRRLLAEESDIEIIGEASNGLEALDKIEQLNPELVFLDIEMPELDGLEVARTIGGEGPLIIFITAYDEFALKAFETHAIDYLLKPVSAERLKMAIGKIHQRRARPREFDKLLEEVQAKRPPARMGVKSGNRHIIVELSRISKIVSKDHYSAIQVDGRELLADETLDTFEKKLDPALFLRTHRSAVVNVTFVKELEREGDRKFVAILADKSRIPISRERLDEVRKRLKL